MPSNATVASRSQDATVRVVADQTCPLCLGRYLSVAECVCVYCESWSCPACVEAIEDTNEVVCLACGGLAGHTHRISTSRH
jgi:hypothetical protein